MPRQPRPATGLRAPAPAKLNLALVVGPPGEDGRHELVTVLQRIDLCDRIDLRDAPELTVGGYVNDTLVRRALSELGRAAGMEPRWAVRIEKRIPVAAGLGGGSSDAATALRLANRTLERPLPDEDLHRLAAALGADVPFFLQTGPKLGEADGTRLSALDLPQDYWAVVVLPHGEEKGATALVYSEFDSRGGWEGYEERRAALLRALGEIRRPRDLAALPPNDLASSPLARELLALGAFRADVTGAGPAVYGLFHHEPHARRAARTLRRRARTWVTVPAWYG
jgi:4-diphosphocytidyl-2-C-methyl-D-erythritol kinase